MTAELTTVIGQFSIVNGQWHNDAPNQVAVSEPKSAGGPGAGKGDLFVLAEVRGQAGIRETIERQLAETVRDSYYLARGSITASLRRAIQTAADLLYDRNSAVSVDERVIGGVVALVRCQVDLFVAQIGPTACFAVLGDHIRRYPHQSTWLDDARGPARPEDEPLLGIRALVEPQIHHLRVGPEDVLVLADSGLAGRLPLDDVVDAVDGSNVKIALKNLGSMAQANDCSAMVLAMVERAQPSMGPLRMNAPASLAKFWRRHGSTPEPAPELAGEADQSSSRPDLESSGSPSHSRIGPGGPTGGLTAPPRQAPAPAVEPANFQAEADEVDEVEAGVKELASTAREATFNPHFRPHRDLEGEEANSAGRLLRSVGAALLTLIAFLGHGLKAALSLVVPNVDHYSTPQAGMQAQRRRNWFFSWKMLLVLALVIPLLVAIIAGISYLQKGRLLEAEYQELVSAAQNKFGQAQSVDATAAFSLMSEANALLSQAEQIKPDQPEIAALRTQMADEADKLGNVQRLYYLPQLRQYTDPGTQLKEIVVQGVELYVLDTGNDRVYHHRLDDLGESLLPDDDTLILAARGQAVDDIVVEELLGMTWMPAGGSRQTSDLLVLNSTGLLEYHPNWGITTSALANGELLAGPMAVSSYFGNFYVLDPQANTLLRYLPTVDGYSGLPESYFPPEQSVNLTGAVDMAIDGAIYLLFKDGRIEKFLSGEPTPFDLAGLDQPLSNPTAIFTAPNEEVQYVYVADAGHQRIVQLNKDGSFVRQFKPRPGEAVTFANLQDIYVDEIGGRLYILDSNNLYVGNIPAE